jgi:two-component system, NarL family, nitrate/nitrite response regulator NarL
MSKRKILVVEDHPTVREVLRTLLGMEDFEVAVAPNGEAGLALADILQPDVVILDVMMPGLDGLEAIPGIVEASPRTRIIMYSAYAETRDDALERGAHGWCLKGEPWDTMAELIRRLIDERDRTTPA